MKGTWDRTSGTKGGERTCLFAFQRAEPTNDYEKVVSFLVEADGAQYFVFTKKTYQYRVNVGLVTAPHLDLIIAFFHDGMCEDKDKHDVAKIINEISAKLGLSDDKTVQVPNPPSPPESKGKPST